MFICIYIFTGLLNNYLTETPEAAVTEDIEVEDPASQEEDEAEIEDESSSKMLLNCLTAIVDTLAANSPKYVPMGMI